MTRLIAPVLVVAALALATESARAQTAAPAAPGTFYYSNGYYYYRPAAPVTYAPQPYYPGWGNRIGGASGYYSRNGVLRGPSGAISGRASHDFDPTGRGVQLHKPWLQPIR